MVESDSSLTCGQCRKSGNFTAPVSVILVFAPGLTKPYPLIPAEEYRVCGACNAIFTLVTRATEAHPTTREAARELIRERVAAGAAAIGVFHDMSTVEELATRTLVLEAGRVAEMERVRQ